MAEVIRGVVDVAKEETLRAMYRSVERMNRHIFEHSEEDDRSDAILSEQCLQINLSGNFKELQK